MADIVDKSTRSRMMSGIRGSDTRPELVVRRFLFHSGYRFRLHVRSLPGRPDLVLAKYRTVVQVQGCFWHRHKGCTLSYTPATNRPFWLRKFRENVERDRRNTAELARMGWRTIVVWECQVRRGALASLARTLSSVSRLQKRRIA